LKRKLKNSEEDSQTIFSLFAFIVLGYKCCYRIA
jgi:hypothetical protein